VRRVAEERSAAVGQGSRARCAPRGRTLARLARLSALASLSVLASLSALAALPACTAGDRQEAAQVIQAVERFRRAENPQKPATVATLRAVACHAGDVCRARDACLASAEATARALRLKSEVEQALAALEADAMPRDTPEARALPGKLDEAESLLNEGFAKLPACDAELMALKRSYGI
jgi:hypothetical protein